MKKCRELEREVGVIVQHKGQRMCLGLTEQSEKYEEFIIIDEMSEQLAMTTIYDFPDEDRDILLRYNYTKRCYNSYQRTFSSNCRHPKSLFVLYDNDKYIRHGENECGYIKDVHQVLHTEDKHHLIIKIPSNKTAIITSNLLIVLLIYVIEYTEI